MEYSASKGVGQESIEETTSVSDPVVKYARENIADPQDIFRSPTEALRPWLKEACVRLNELIFTEAYDLALKRGILNPDDPPLVRVGRELELLLFSDQFDSRIDSKINPHPSRPNPNYTPEHLAKVARFTYDIMKGKSYGGLGHLLQQGSGDNSGFQMEGKILGEMRARPVNVAGYIKDTEIIEEYMREQSEARGIRPVVHANHLHVSLTDSQGGTNLMEDTNIRHSIRLGVMDAYHRLLPLSRLPEEVDDPNYGYSQISSYSAKTNGASHSPTNPQRVEGRVNSTEYMYDPYLTLFVNLLGVYRGLHYQSEPGKIDRDYPLSYDGWGEFYFNTDGVSVNYMQSVERLFHDQVLREHLRPGVIHMLQRAFKEYWNISTAKKSAAEVRRESERLATRYAKVAPAKRYSVA